MLKRQSSQSRIPKTVGAKSILGVLVALFIFLLLLSSVIHLFTKYTSIRAHIKELTLEQEQLKQKKESVSTMNSYIATPEGKEEVFRDKYRLVKPGEGMIVITTDAKEEVAPVQKPGIIRVWNSIIRGLGFR